MSVFDDLMKHKIFLQRLGIGEANLMYKEIVKISLRLEKLLEAKDTINIRELNKTTNQLRDALSKAIIPSARKRLKDFTGYEMSFNLRLLNRVKELKGRLNAPNQSMLENLLSARALKYSKDGKLYTIDQSLGLLAARVAKDLNNTVKIAQVQAKTAGIAKVGEEVGKRIKEVTKGLLFRRATVVGVTEINHLSSQVLQAIYHYNDDVIERLRWDTMLDQYVCEDCESLEGKEWEVDEQSEEPPLHANCRCVLAPVSVFEENSKDTTDIRQ